MNKYLLLTIIASLAACSAPLKKDDAISVISNDAGIPPESIKNTSYCSFVVTARTSQRGDWRECILAISNQGIYVYEGDLNKIVIKQALKLDFGNMRGVDIQSFGRTREVHILVDTGVIALQLSNDRTLINLEATERLYKIILNHGVPKFAAKGTIDDTSPMVIPVIVK